MWKVSANRDNSARRRHRRFHSQQRRRASSAVDLRRAKNVTLVNPLVERTAFNYVVGPLSAFCPTYRARPEHFAGPR